MKKLLIFILIFVANFYSNDVEATSVNFRFDWRVKTVDVPLHASIDDYKDNFVLVVYIDDRELAPTEYFYHIGSTSIVNTSKVGKYQVTVTAQLYNYSSASSETTIIYNVYDTEGPDLSVSTTSITTVYNNIPNYLDYVKAVDNSDNVTISVNDTAVAYSYVGSYPVLITAKDSSNNSREIQIIVHVIDPFAPRISLINPLDVALGEDINVTDYFYGYDDYDKVITNRIIVENYNKNQAGTQYIYASLTDLAGNETRIPFTINVSDKTKPVFYFNTNNATVDIESDFTTDLFKSFILSIMDDNNSLSIDNVIIDFTTVLHELGTYTVYYSISDASGNEGVGKLLVTVVQTKGPDIIYSDLTFKNGEIFDASQILDSIYVEDKYDSSAHSTLKIDYSGVNFSIPGTYAIIITACNSSGEYTYETMLITIEGQGMTGVLQYWPLSFLLLAPIIYIGYNKYKKKQELELDV